MVVVDWICDTCVIVFSLDLPYGLKDPRSERPLDYPLALRGNYLDVDCVDKLAPWIEYNRIDSWGRL